MACVVSETVIQSPLLVEASATGKPGPLPARRNNAASTVTVQPESITSSTSSTGPEGILRHLEYSVKILALMESVLLHLLRFVIANLADRIDERQTQTSGESAGKIRNQGRVVSRRNTGYPMRGRGWLPPLADHLGHRFHQLVSKASGVLIVRDQSAPTGIAPAGQDASLLCLQVLRKIAPEPVFAECPGHHLLLRLEDNLSMAKKASSLYCQSTIYSGPHNRFAPTHRTFAALGCFGIVQCVSQERHQAVSAVYISQNLRHSSSRCSGKASDTLVIHAVVDQVCDTSRLPFLDQWRRRLDAHHLQSPISRSAMSEDSTRPVIWVS